MKQKRGAVALDVGGTKIACGLYLEDGGLLHRRSVPTSQTSAADSIVQLVSLVEECVQAAPLDVVVAVVGVVIPGWVDRRRRTVWAPNLSGWDHLPLEALLAEKVPLPIVLDSDRNGYVRGESWLGVARGLLDVVFLAAGTGIGAGILVDGKIVHGADNLAGAVGWMALNPGYEEAYARMGCFEAEASGNSVGRKAALRLGEAGLTSRELCERAAHGDRRAQEVLDGVIVYLGMGVANLVSTLNPEMIVLGGGLFEGEGCLLPAVRREAARWAQPFAVGNVRIERSALGGNAGLAGAARIALDNV